MTNFYVALVLLALAGLLLWLAGRKQRQLGLPAGRVLYRDLESGDRLRRPLYAADLDLTGKPDYLLRSPEGLVPVEVKSGRTPAEPYEAHIFQLAAYCALVERAYGQRPGRGIIRYPQASFEVAYTAELEGRLLDLLVEMRNGRGREQGRSHQQAARCRGCGFLVLCDQAL